jgi:uncharacterized protein YjiS (DUF1127 family)
MYSHAQPRAFSATALLYLAAALRTAAYRVRSAARQLDLWIARRRTRTPAVRELQAMSYRELRDIGLTGFDVQHLAWGGEAPGRPWQNADAEVAIACEACGGDAEDTHKFDGLAQLETHVLKDIGAPHWMVARAAERPNMESLRWIGLEHC